MSGVANPLEFAKEREIVKGQHVLDHGTYVSDPKFVPTQYPKWMFKGEKSKVVKDEEAELLAIEAGWVNEPPKQKVVSEDN